MRLETWPRLPQLGPFRCGDPRIDAPRAHRRHGRSQAAVEESLRRSATRSEAFRGVQQGFPEICYKAIRFFFQCFQGVCKGVPPILHRSLFGLTPGVAAEPTVFAGADGSSISPRAERSVSKLQYRRPERREPRDVIVTTIAKTMQKHVSGVPFRASKATGRLLTEARAWRQLASQVPPSGTRVRPVSWRRPSGARGFHDGLLRSASQS